MQIIYLKDNWPSDMWWNSKMFTYNYCSDTEQLLFFTYCLKDLKGVAWIANCCKFLMA